ncbi:fungal-specific transcription factor domain-containing protein [Thelonectria olida]|uniref:Fungal-specific transcription factor domain-containing protein n=1 Tax=Thelonectria olida TaxID=1576542 RepID=A0A9P8WFG6_9HYPO|nr:fungal-specific transcription factor domain-containing protein [Thelonectria olida]
MSAAHLYQNDEDRTPISLEFQTEAMSYLSSELATLDLDSPSPPASEVTRDTSNSQTALVKDELLLSIILLGMTAAWHDPSSLGLSHLSGSRPLFKAWMSSHGLDNANDSSPLTQSQSFMVSSMAYWEAMASFLVDQESEALSYLDNFLHPSPLALTYPSPWTGVGTPIFIYLAKTGTLLRKKRTLRNLKLFKHGDSCRTVLYSELVDEARALEQDILKTQLPFVSLIEDTGDVYAPPDHFRRIARCYRLAALLELYRAFPEVAEDSTTSEQTRRFDKPGLGKQAQLVLGLAFSILGLVESIPDDSSTKTTHNLLLLIAGSALARLSPDFHTLNQDVAHRRQFVRDRVVKLHMCVGLRPVTHVSIILDEVWIRMDWAVKSGSEAGAKDNLFSDRVHWVDIMFEKRLETILG